MYWTLLWELKDTPQAVKHSELSLMDVKDNEDIETQILF